VSTLKKTLKKKRGWEKQVRPSAGMSYKKKKRARKDVSSGKKLYPKGGYC